MKKRKVLLFKEFIKCLKSNQKIHAYGWIKDNKRNNFSVKNAPSYFMELPVTYFHFKKDGILNVRFAFSLDMFR